MRVSPGTNYNVYRWFGGEVCVRRMSAASKTWEHGSGMWLKSYKPWSADDYMYLLHSNDSIWLVCEKDRHRYRDAKKCTLVAEGPKKDLWPTFLTYAELMR